ncbi:MAG: hypothetical protein IT462_14875 [Planctomycetes bacterium]|nr:hypothetical protein [Planctomycetota bacterium]
MKFAKARTLAAVAFLALIAAGAASAQQGGYGEYAFYTGPSYYGNFIRAINNPNTIAQFSLQRLSAGEDTLRTCYFYNFSSNTPDISYIESCDMWIDENSDGVVDGGDTHLSEGDLTDWGNYGFVIFSPEITLDENIVMFLFTISVAVDTPLFSTVDVTLASECFDYHPYTSDPCWDYDSDVWLDGNPAPWWILWNNSSTVLSSYAPLALWPGYAVPAANAIKGSTSHPVLQFSVSQNSDGYIPTITRISVTGNGNGHTAIFSDITAIRLYEEKGNPNGVVDDADTQIAVGTRVGTTGFVYQFICDLDVPTTGYLHFLVVVDVSATATDSVIRLYTNRGSITHNGSPFWYDGVTQVLDEPQTITRFIAGSYLAITAQPNSTTAGAALNAGAGGVRVEARTNLGALFTAFSGPVKAFIVSGPGSAFTYNSVTTAQASGGIAIFSSLALPTAGSYRIQFTAPPFADTPASSSFVITHGAAYKVAISTQPSDGMVGVPIPPPPVATVYDQYDNLVANYNGNVSAQLLSNPAGGTLQNNQVVAVNGVATFPNLLLNKAGAGYSLLFSGPGLASSQASTSFAMAVGAPAQLVLTQQPQSIFGGALVAPSPRVQVQDVGGNTVIDFVGDMTASIGNNPSGGTLTGSLTIAVESGIGLFTNLSIDLAGTGYTLTFSVNAGAATGESTAFDVMVGSAVKLTVTSQPTDTTGGMPFNPLVVVEVQDAGGNVIASDDATEITASITPGTGETGGELWGALLLQVVDGVAIFPDLSVSKCGPTPYTLTFMSSGPHTTAVSTSFIISLGPLARVGVTTEPALASYGQVFGQQPAAALQDLGGNLILSSANISVSIKAGTGTPNATLSGTTNMFALNGQVTFTNLAIDFAGVDYVLVFSSAGLNDGLSLPFNVASPATKLVIGTQPGAGQLGLLLISQPTIQICDDVGTVVPDNFTLVTVEIAPTTGSPGASLVGTTQIYATNGAVAYTNLQVDKPGKGYRLKFTCYPALIQAISDEFDVAGIPVKLNLFQQPGGGNYAGEPLTSQPQVEVCDSNGIRCIGENTIVVNAYITPATGTNYAVLMGTNPITVVNGLAAFTDFAIDRPGADYTLSFSSDPSLFQVQSNAFDIGGTMPPSGSSEDDVVGGVDGGSCSAQSEAVIAWALLLLVVIAGLSAAQRRRCRS